MRNAESERKLLLAAMVNGVARWEFFTGSKTGWVVGDRGTILYTTTGGDPPASPPSGIQAPQVRK